MRDHLVQHQENLNDDQDDNVPFDAQAVTMLL
jgi:hypothetical protein